MTTLREYQQRTIDQLYAWFEAGNAGHPCIVLPTGSGKSHIIAALCKDVLQSCPEAVILMLTHVHELISQNAEKMRRHWPGAPMGIYSAGLRQKTLGEPITFGGIQSLRTKAHLLGHVDIILIDECHLVSHKDEGGYRKLINELLEINPNLRVVGLTATPYRMGYGLITDKPALFNALIEPTSIEELVEKGYLAPLRSKHTMTRQDITGIHKCGGDFKQGELQTMVDITDLNMAICKEVIERAGDRKAWLFFCAGVEHAKNVSDILNSLGVVSECITGKTSKNDRRKIIDGFKGGKIKALTNANVLTTGFDYPDIDLIAMLRPTLSPGLYMQMAGRGLRPKSCTDHCLVLDFAGNVSVHGPITAVTLPKKPGEGGGPPPLKVCDECFELVHISAKICPACGFEFPPPEKEPLALHNNNIMVLEDLEMDVTTWMWRVHTSKKTGKEMLVVSYYGRLGHSIINEYHPFCSGEWAQRKIDSLWQKSKKQSLDLAMCREGIESGFEGDLLKWLAEELNEGTPPKSIKYLKDGRYFKVISRSWDE